jgi:hypothetical protein
MNQKEKRRKCHLRRSENLERSDLRKERSIRS